MEWVFEIEPELGISIFDLSSAKEDYFLSYYIGFNSVTAPYGILLGASADMLETTTSRIDEESETP